ncbi:MAG: glycosyltransferase [Bacteroidota bacterium]
MESTSKKISIVIVNYNVAYFLEQCLNSVYRALEGIDGEVFVVDNNSIDGSIDMIEERFPSVELIANTANVGFSKANNQAMMRAKGEYILLLNPDTVVEEDTFQQCITFMDEQPEAGGLGVRMIDGKGNFLPESKRGLPTPAVAFYKIFGLSRLFPKSRVFGKYHMGYLDEHEVNEIEILSGAYMFMRKKALEKVGLLDEAFFMYGEDIDLSYRIIEGGYKNYYFPKTQIIHYKGESTKKSSINYVFVFYRAMVIFAQKHFSQKKARLFSFFINMAIYFRASLALLARLVKRLMLPLFDFAVLVTGLYFLTFFWKQEHIEFPREVLWYAIPGYALTWILATVFSSGYDYPIKLKSFFKGSILGTVVILIVYALLPKSVQFSRLFILLGMGGVLVYYLLSRVLLHFTLKQKFDLSGIKSKNFAIVGHQDEAQRVAQILKNTPQKVHTIHQVTPDTVVPENYTGSLNQLDQIVHIHSIDEIIFCAKNTPAEKIIHWMSRISSEVLEFKIAQPESMYLIGSNSVDSSGDLYLMEIDNISTKSSKRNKRAFDFGIAFLLLLFSPFLIWSYTSKAGWYKNVWQVFTGQKSFVGYAAGLDERNLRLPQIREGILTPTLHHSDNEDQTLNAKLNLIYARDYSILTDLQILYRNWDKLDR